MQRSTEMIRAARIGFLDDGSRGFLSRPSFLAGCLGQAGRRHPVFLGDRPGAFPASQACRFPAVRHHLPCDAGNRSEEHTSELQSLMRISYAVFCLKKKTATYSCNIANHVTIKISVILER